METALEALISCSVCLEIYSKPRVLKCLHTLCYECIEQIKIYNIVTCPECRENTAIDDIKPDFKTQTLIDLHKKSTAMAATPEEGAKQCDVCEKFKVIQTKCLVCVQFMCSDCERAHSKMTLSRDHQMMSIQEVVNALTAKLEDTKLELVKGQQVIQMHSHGSDTIIRQLLEEKQSQLQRVSECEAQSMVEIRNHHDILRKVIEEKANEVIWQLENHKVQNTEVENEIERRLDYLTTAGTSRDVDELTGIVDGIGQSLTEDVQVYKSQLPDLNKTLPLKVVQGTRIPPEQMTKVLVNNDANGHLNRMAAPGKLSKLLGHQYSMAHKMTYDWTLPMKLHKYGSHLWSATYNDGVYVYDLDGKIVQKIKHKYMKSACGVAQAYNEDVIVACGEHHDLLRFDKEHRYLGRITSGSFSDVYAYKQHIYTLDYDRGMVLVFDFNPDSNKWFCFRHWKIDGYSYGHYCDKLMVNEAGIYVSSYNSHSIYILTHDGHMLCTIGTEGSGQEPGTFQGLILCDIDSKGNILACDRVSHTIQMLEKTTGRWSILNIQGKERISYPADVAVDESGDAIWVVTNQQEMLKLHVDIYNTSHMDIKD